MTTVNAPSRGDVWLVTPDPTRGHEQSGRRPALVVSADAFNRGPAGLVVVIPMTTKDKGIPLHVRIDPPEGGTKERCFIKCEDVRSISKERLVNRWGTISPKPMADVEDRLRILLGLF